MKELSIEEKAKRYDEALARANEMIKDMTNMGGVAKVDDIQYIFPELKESEDERIRKGLIEYFLHYPDHEITYYGLKADFVISWLEKQGKNNMGISEATKQKLEDNLNKALEKETPESWNEFLEKQGEPAKLSEEEQNKFAKGVLTSCALSFINYLDAHKYKGKMCVSNGECEDIENAFHNAMWDRLHRYYCKYIEKQGEQKPVEEKIWSINDAKDGDVLNSVRVQATIIFKGFADDDKHILAYCGLQKGIFISQEILWDRDFEPASEYWKNALYDAMTARGYEWDADRLELKKIEQKPADDIERKYNPCYNMPFKKAQEYISNRGFDIPWTNCDVFVDFRYVTQTVANILRWADNNPKQNPAWSEEDEKEFEQLLDILHANGYESFDIWLKSLKPQNWKPSESDIRILEQVIDGTVNPINYHATLYAILEQLKKLR